MILNCFNLGGEVAGKVLEVGSDVKTVTEVEEMFEKLL